MAILNQLSYGRRFSGWTGLTLASCTLLLAGCSPPAPGASILPALPPGVRALAAEVRYDVNGATVDEIRTSLRLSAAALPGGATGYHRWNIKWTYRYARGRVYCVLSDIAIDLESTITLPEWQRPDDADPALFVAWDQYVANLRAHEYGHRVLAYQAARDIRRALDRLRVEDCGFIATEAKSAGEAILERHREDSAAFDADPANGVSWPPRSR